MSSFVYPISRFPGIEVTAPKKGQRNSEPKVRQSGIDLIEKLMAEKNIHHLDEVLSKIEREFDKEEIAQTGVISAARHICMSYELYQTEVDNHLEAYENAKRRQKELRKQLEKIITHIRQYELQKQAHVAHPLNEYIHKPKTESRDTEVQGGIPFWSKVSELLHFQINTQHPYNHRTPKIVDLKGIKETERDLANKECNIEEFINKNLKLSAKQSIKYTVKEQEIASPKKQQSCFLAFYCLGSFRVFQNDQLISNWNGHKGQLILKYLVAHAGKPVSKDKLMEVIWPEADPEATRRNLHQAIYSLRQSIRQKNTKFQHILFQNERYSLNPEIEVWIDFVELEKRIRAGQRLEKEGKAAEAMAEYGIAEGLYQGGFMEDDLYEEWTEPRRDQLQNLYLEIAEKLSAHYLNQKQYTATIAQCQRILALDNCHEPAYQHLMRCYMAQGQRHMVVRQYQTCTQALEEELGLPPSEETQALYRQITPSA